MCVRFRSASDEEWAGFAAAHVLHAELHFETARRIFPERLPELARLRLEVADAIRSGIAADVAVQHRTANKKATMTVGMTVGGHGDEETQNLWLWTTSQTPEALNEALERQMLHDRRYFQHEQSRARQP